MRDVNFFNTAGVIRLPAINGNLYHSANYDDMETMIKEKSVNITDSTGKVIGAEKINPGRLLVLAEVLLTNQTLSPPKSCPWPVGASGTLCNFLYLGDFYQDAAIEKALAAANPTCNIQMHLSCHTVVFVAKVEGKKRKTCNLEDMYRL